MHVYCKPLLYLPPFMSRGLPVTCLPNVEVSILVAKITLLKKDFVGVKSTKEAKKEVKPHYLITSASGINYIFAGHCTSVTRTPSKFPIYSRDSTNEFTARRSREQDSWLVEYHSLPDNLAFMWREEDRTHTLEKDEWNSDKQISRIFFLILGF